jgi:hypothetical protein
MAKQDCRDLTKAQLVELLDAVFRCESMPTY